MVLGTTSAIAAVNSYWDLISRWDELGDLDRANLLADLTVEVIGLGLGAAAKHLACFTEDTEVKVPPNSGGTWYVAAGGVFVAGVAGAVILAQDRKKKRLEGRDDPFADAETDWLDDGEPMPPLPEDDDLDLLCDRLFHGEADDWLPDPPDSSGACDQAPRNSLTLTTPTSPNTTVRQMRTTRPSALETVDSPRSCPLPERKKTHPIRGKLGLAFLLFAVFGSLFCAFHGWRASHDDTVSIAQLRPGDRVVMGASSAALDAAERDLPFETGVPESQLNPATWKLVRMRAEILWDDGTLDDVNVETLQSPAWLRDHDVRVGSFVPIPMDLAEMGLPEGLQAKVLAIERCPPVDEGAGRVVLTTINHLNADVIELTVETVDGRRETFQPTGSHKLYRASDNRWVSACELRQGDQLAGTEEPLTVVASRHVPGVHRVYNMTVQGEHVYHVSSLGALAHNVKCWRGGGRTPRNFTPRPGVDDLANHPKRGLSTFKTPKNAAARPGSKAHEIDTDRLDPEVFDIVEHGDHVSIRPKTQEKLAAWASSRDSGGDAVHSLTQQILDALTGTTFRNQ
jgi:hypothetical protein